MAVPATAQSKKSENGKGETFEAPGGDIFGFTSPTDVGNKGEYSFANEFDGRLQKRDGTYRAFSNKTEFGYTFTENFWLGGSAFLSAHHIRGVPDLDDLSEINFDGLSFQPMLRLIERSASNPFALAISAEPRWARIDGGNGLRSTAYAVEFKIMMDGVIVRDKLFWGANLNWAPIRGQDSADRSIWLDQSASVASMAITAQVTDKLFIGAEIRHLAAYDGTWFEDRLGYAVYLGPTLLWNITDKVALNLTWQPQIAGKSVDTPDLRYDLNIFDRSQFRIKLAATLN